MTTHLDYYQILQVHPEAEQEVIHAAYRKLAAKYHPDVNRAPGAAERMKQINNAYEVLSDPASRAEYDASHKVKRPSATGKKAAGTGKTWKNLFFVALLLLLVFVVPRFGPAALLSITRVAVPLLIVGLVIWFIYSFTKPKR